MADKMMRMAGRTPNGIAKPLAVNTDGMPIVNKKWAFKAQALASAMEIRDTTNHYIYEDNSIDISDYPISSLRIRNSMDASVEIRLLYDGNKNQTNWLCDLNDEQNSIVVPAGNNNSTWYLVTPDDLPFLNYIKYLKLAIKAETAPTTGSITVDYYGRG